MADPKADYRFLYIEAGLTDIDSSPFFDVQPEIDIIVDRYIHRVCFTLAEAVEERLRVRRRLSADYADTPLHLSYSALQSLYRTDQASTTSTAADITEV